MRRSDPRQTGFFDITSLHGVPANEEEEPAPKVRVTETNPEYVNVSEEHSRDRPFCISLHRKNGSATFALTLTIDQMKQLIIQGSKLLGVIAFDLDELDDSFPETMEDCDG